MTYFCALQILMKLSLLQLDTSIVTPLESPVGKEFVVMFVNMSLFTHVQFESQIKTHVYHCHDTYIILHAGLF